LFGSSWARFGTVEVEAGCFDVIDERDVLRWEKGKYGIRECVSQ
jgi:hypothetical protein